MKSTFLFSLLLAILSGAAALSHELLWTRRLVDLLGATGEATSRVFGCFFLGLALGGLLAARILPRIKHPWLAVALSELAIAVLSIPALCLPWWSEGIWPALGPEQLVSWPGTLIKTFLSAAVVLPPAIPMGMTLPFFAAAVLRRHGTMRYEGTLIYGCNTLGGVLGVLLSSSFLLELQGVEGNMLTAITVNLTIGIVAWRLNALSETISLPTPKQQNRKRPEGKNKRKEISNQTTTLSPVGSLLLSFISGLAMLALEVLSIRLVSMVVPSSFQATAGVLASVIFLLAIAAIATPLLLKTRIPPKTWLLGLFIASSVAASLAPHLLYQRTKQLTNVSYLAAMAGDPIYTTTDFMFAVCSLTLITVGPALFIGGLVFPFTFAWADGEGNGPNGDEDKAKRFGYLLAANGIGGILGAELTQILIIPAWGIYQGFAAVGVLYGLGFAYLITPWKSPKLLRLITSCLVLAAPVALSGWLIAPLPYLSPNVKVSYEILVQEFGEDGVLLVVKTPSCSQGILVNNQYLLGSSGDLRDERRQVLLPMLLHPNPDSICCVGVATGITAGAALDYSETCQLTAVEISSLVADAARKHFSGYNRSLFENPQAEVVVEDGRTYIAASSDQFDVIVGDLYRPYGAGEGRLFSVEHFRATRRALQDGGLFCQWLPMFQLTESHFRIITASFLEAYPDASLLLCNRKSNTAMMALVGWKKNRFDGSTLQQNCDELKKRGSVTDKDILNPDFVKSMFLGQVDSSKFKDEPLNTLGNVRIEIVAGRRKITKDPRGNSKEQEPYLKGEAWEEFRKSLHSYLH